MLESEDPVLGCHGLHPQHYQCAGGMRAASENHCLSTFGNRGCICTIVSEPSSLPLHCHPPCLQRSKQPMRPIKAPSVVPAALEDRSTLRILYCMTPSFLLLQRCACLPPRSATLHHPPLRASSPCQCLAWCDPCAGGPLQAEDSRQRYSTLDPEKKPACTFDPMLMFRSGCGSCGTRGRCSRDPYWAFSGGTCGALRVSEAVTFMMSGSFIGGSSSLVGCS